MAIRSGFFNSVNGDRKYDARRFAEYFASFIGNGVFPNPSDGLQVMANDDMTVTVKAGKAWINGYIFINDDDYILEVEPADGVLNRIDRVVARYDTVDREIRLEVKKGTFASKPTAPDLQRDADAYELALADVYVAAGSISISQADITDLRLNSELCGIVHGTVEQVDTTTLFNQYLAWLQEKKSQYDQDMLAWTEQKKNEFEDWAEAQEQGFEAWRSQEEQNFYAWLEHLQDILDENVAGNLLNLIESHKTDRNNPHGVTAEQIGAETPTGAQAKANAAETNAKNHANSLVGTLSNLLTTAKNNVVAAINEIFGKVEDVEGDLESHKADKVAHIDYAVASGTNTYTANIQGITALVEGLSVKIKFQNANTGASTLNINGLGAKEIRKSNGNTLSSGNIKAGQICHLVYTGSVFQLLGEGGEYGTAQPQHVLEGYTIGTEEGIKEGTMVNQGAKIITPSTVNQAIPAGYHNGNGHVVGSLNLTPVNIKKGVSIFGIVGTLEEGYYVEAGKRTMDYNTTYVVTAPTGFRAVHAYSLLGTFSEVRNEVIYFAVKSVSPLYSIDVGTYSGRIVFNGNKVTFYNHFDYKYDMLWGAIFAPE